MVNRSPLTAFAASVPSLPSPPLTAAFSKERGGRSSPPCNDVKNELLLLSGNIWSAIMCD